VMRALGSAIRAFDVPAVEKVAETERHDPFRVLVATLLSARTQDGTTAAASERLFDAASTPLEMLRLPTRRLERLIYPVSFYRTKARHIRSTCRLLVDHFGGDVPRTMEELLLLPGVGRKTANLVLILAYGSRTNICVDTHVHRLANRLGWVVTRSPEETEQALYESTAARWWPLLNLYLVTWGQNVCRPVNPRCDACPLYDLCPRIGVVNHQRAQVRRSLPSRLTS
jgi:endonuclease III